MNSDYSLPIRLLLMLFAVCAVIMMIITNLRGHWLHQRLRPPESETGYHLFILTLNIVEEERSTVFKIIPKICRL